MTWTAALLAVVPWWVEDAATAERLRAALAELWPECPCEVRVGAPDGQGIWYEDPLLHLVTDGVAREGAVQADPGLEVALIRSWMRPVPEVGAVRREPPPAPEAAREPAPWRGRVALSAGPGLGVVKGGPPLHLAAQGSGTWRSFEVGGVGSADLGAVLGSDGDAAVLESRVGAGAHAGFRLPMAGGEYVSTLGLAGRWQHTVVADARSVGADALTLGGELRMSWWRATSDAWALGVGLSVQADDLTHPSALPVVTLSDGTLVHHLPALAAVEFGVARALPSAR